MDEARTWPCSSNAPRAFCSSLHKKSRCYTRRKNPDEENYYPARIPRRITEEDNKKGDVIETDEEGFESLPYDILRKIGGGMNIPSLWSASGVCRAWREALRPLREGMVLVQEGKKFKHGRGGVRKNTNKALESFLKGASRGCSAAMVDAGLMLWEMGKKAEGTKLYREAAGLGDPAGQCNLGLSYLQDSHPNHQEAVKWFYQAAFAGNVRAQYSLALCLQQGRGIERNSIKAVEVRAKEGKEVDIHMVCSTKPGLLLSTIRALDGLGVDVKQAVISCLNGFASDVFQAEGSESRIIGCYRSSCCCH